MDQSCHAGIILSIGLQSIFKRSSINTWKAQSKASLRSCLIAPLLRATCSSVGLRLIVKNAVLLAPLSMRDALLAMA